MAPTISRGCARSRPTLAAAAGEIERRRELPEPIVAGADRARPVPPAAAALARRRRIAAGEIRADHRGTRQDRRQRRLVRQPEFRLLDDRGASRRPRWRARFSAGRAASWPGGRDPARRASRRAATGSPRAGPSPAAAITRAGSAAMCRSSRRTERRAARRRHAGRAHDAVPEKRDRIHRHLAHDRAARHRQRPVFGQGFVRAGGLFGRCPVAPRRRRRRKPGLLYRFSSLQLYASGFAGVALGIARAHARPFHRAGARQDPARRADDDAQQQCDAVAGGAAPRRGSRRPATGCFVRSRTSPRRSRERGHVTLDERMAIRLASTFAIHTVARSRRHRSIRRPAPPRSSTRTRSSAASATSIRSRSSCRAASSISRPSANTCSASNPTI